MDLLVVERRIIDATDVAVERIRSLLAGSGEDAATRGEIAERVAAAIGLTEAQYPVAELFWGARKLLESLAAERPLVAIVDDIHVETTPDKFDAWEAVRFDRIFKGDDWRGTRKGRELEERLGAVGVEVVYFPYTMHTSSTMLRRALMTRAGEPTAPVGAVVAGAEIA